MCPSTFGSFHLKSTSTSIVSNPFIWNSTWPYSVIPLLFLKLNIKLLSLHGKGFTEHAFSANSITSTYCIVALSELIARSRKTDIQTNRINFNKILFYTNPSLFKSKGNQLCKKEWNRYVNLSSEDARTFCWIFNLLSKSI